MKSAITGYKTVNQFLQDFVDGVKDTPWPAALAAALPWTAALGKAVSSSVAPVKFILTLYDNLVRIDDANELGEIACTTAFQQSVQQALQIHNVADSKGTKQISQNAVEDVQNKISAKEYDFTTMRLNRAIHHEFFIDAKGWLPRFLNIIGFDERTQNFVVADVEQRFQVNIELLLTNRETAGKFEPFYKLLLLDDDSSRARRALHKHAAYQQWMYLERRILREEPYALQHTYVRTDCGELKWGDFESRRKERLQGRLDKPYINAFIDHPDHGGRADLVDAVLRNLSDKDLKDLIVIQGPAGTGKSSLTLRLCHELLVRGLRPIRIELKHLDTTANRHIRDTLPEAVRVGDEDFDPSGVEYSFGRGLFLDDSIFLETAQLNGTTISRYVLILDAWDEISIGAEEGYQQHIERLLKEITDLYLDDSKRRIPVRIILTGRPTEAVTQGRLMRDDSRLLTLRYFTAKQLREFHGLLRNAVELKPINSPDWTRWDVPEEMTLVRLQEKYQQCLDQLRARAHSYSGPAATSDHQGLELLGSPLLGLLSLRLLAQWLGDPQALFESQTVLYRSLVDLLLGGAKVPIDAKSTKASHIRGEALRRLLWSTAEAMSVLGVEGLSKLELLKRVRIPGEFDRQVEGLIDDNKLSRLMVSFFFHGGRSEQGCEFSHKSFREFLYAEQIIDVLKNCGGQTDPLPERDVAAGYWRDFETYDPRRKLAHRLAKLLGPQWLTREVGHHLKRLIDWEVQRSSGQDLYPPVKDGAPTQSVALSKWLLIRDSLVDIWDWWCEGVHLRPQPYDDETSSLKWYDPVALTVTQTDRFLSAHTTASIRPPRLITIDSHLGDGLFQLCCDVHRALIEYGGNGAKTDTGRRYQCVDSKGQVRFNPSGGGQYWENYWHRIEAAGYRWRFRGQFPQGIDLSYTSWMIAQSLGGMVFVSGEGTNLRNVDFRGANLFGMDFGGTDLRGSDFGTAVLNETNFTGANLSDATFSGREIGGVIMPPATLRRAELTQARLVRADLSGATLEGASLDHADLRDAILEESSLREANLQWAKLEGANLSGADLEGADLRNAIVSDTQLSQTVGKPKYGPTAEEHF